MRFLSVANLTIIDIAKLAGVGKATVSRVINNSGYVKANTRAKIDAVMRRVGYVPSAAARALSKQESNFIGMIVPEMDNPFFGMLMKGVLSVLIEKDLTLLICSTEDRMDLDLRALNTIHEQRVKGLIYTPIADDKLLHIALESLSKLDVPIVLLDRMLGTNDYDGVYTNDYSGAYIGTQALLQAGHTDIGIVVGNLAWSNARKRMEGFKDAIESFGLKVKEKNIIHGHFRENITYEKTISFIESNGNDLPTAFFVSNNLCSRGFIRAVYEKNLKIPDDLAYVGFDALEELDILGVKFSHLYRSPFAMGKMAAELLLKRLSKSDDGTRRQIIIDSELNLIGSEKRIKR
jgi:LacI family transcriptional regulator